MELKEDKCFAIPMKLVTTYHQNLQGVEDLAVKLLLYNTCMNNTYKETVFGLDQINTVTFADTQAVL